MGALSAEQLARVIAEEIQSQITEKSLRGHVAQDDEPRQSEATGPPASTDFAVISAKPGNQRLSLHELKKKQRPWIPDRGRG